MTSSNAWQTCHVLYARADNATGAITVQLGDVLSGDVLEEDAPVQGQWGFLSMPAPPIPGVSAAEAISLTSTNTDFVIGGRSVRSGIIAGLIRMGETCVFADGSQACSLYKLDGSIVHYTTTDNTITGQAVFTKTDPTGHRWVTPWTRCINDSSGWHFMHTSGASLDFGFVGLSGPFSLLADAGFSSYFTAKAHMVRIDGEIVVLGSGGVGGANVPDPVVKAVELITLLGTINAAIVALTAAVNGITTATPGATALTAAQVNTVFIPAMSAAIAGALGTIASKSVMVGS